MDRTKSNDIEDLDRLVRSSGSKAASILANIDALDLSNMCPELLHRLYSHSNFLPELNDPVYRACDQEVCVWCERDEGKLVFVHQRFGVARRDREGGDIKLFIRELSTLLLCDGRWQRGTKVIVRGAVYQNQSDGGTASTIIFTIIWYGVAVGLGLDSIPIFKVGPRTLVCIIWGLGFALHDSVLKQFQAILSCLRVLNRQPS